MVHVSRSEFQAIVRAQREKSAMRKAKKDEKRSSLPWGDKAAKKPRRIRHISMRGAIKEQIVHLLGLLDARLNGKECRLGHLCPAYRDLGKHDGQVGYHLTPQKRGDAARFLPENVVWACHRANNGERWNRDLYRQHHVTLFGAARVERIEAIARTKADYSMADLREKLAEVRALVEAA